MLVRGGEVWREGGAGRVERERKTRRVRAIAISYQNPFTLILALVNRLL